jgi:peptidoglycan/xylan/chitin deacetylase (PgdA/CDA1 family)
VTVGPYAGSVGRSAATRLVLLCVVACLSAAAATAPLAATAAAGGELPMAAAPTAPTLRLTDLADTPGKLDLRSVRLTQSGGSLVATFRVNGEFRVSWLTGTGNRIVCFELVPRGHPALGQRVCLIGGSGKHALYRLPLVSGGPRPRFVAATVEHIRRGARVTFAYSRIGLGAGRLDWSATSTWKGRAACASVCHDLVPDRGRAAWGIDTYTVDGCTAAGPSQRFGGPSAGRRVALTFDDGPSVYTPQVLSVLNHYGVHATFMEIGEQVGARAGTARAVIRSGDAIGDHTWSHPLLTAANTANQIGPTQKAIHTATGYRPCLLRAPYGAASAAVVDIARSLGLLTIQWDVDPQDWARPGAGVIAQRVLAAVHAGAIVIMHDGGGDRSETVAALRTIVPTLLARGYHLVTVPQLLGLRPAYAYRR